MYQTQMDNIHYFTNVDINTAIQIESVIKQGRMYAAAWKDGPICIQTPVVAVEGLSDTHAIIKTQGDNPFNTFLNKVEEHVKEVAKSCTEILGLSADQIDASFKSFIQTPGSLKCRKVPEFVAFDADGEIMHVLDEGTHVRAILRLDQLSIGKTEMGCLWRLIQCKVCEPPPSCLISMDVELQDDEQDDDDAVKPTLDDDDFV
jgi:hypothetical protein